VFYLGREYLACKVVGQKEFFLLDVECDEKHNQWAKDKFGSIDKWLDKMLELDSKLEDNKIVRI
jgi:hypothetical protein